MDLSKEKQPMGLSRPGSISAVIQIVRDLTTRLMLFFTLSEEERTQAGIHLKNNRRE